MNQAQRLGREERGSSVVELGLVLLPLLAIVFITIDCAWVVFAKASLQYAVRQGCRYAVTSQTLPGMGQDDSIKTIVQNNSFGFLTGTNNTNNITIQYYNPTTLQPTNSNAGGNIVQVSINNASVAPIIPFWISASALQASAVSSDVMESSPGGVPPPR